MFPGAWFVWKKKKGIGMTWNAIGPHAVAVEERQSDSKKQQRLDGALQSICHQFTPDKMFVIDFFYPSAGNLWQVPY